MSTTTETAPQSAFKRWLSGVTNAADLGMLPVIAALILIWIVFEVLNANFLTPRNLSNLAAQIVVTGTLALAEIYIILLGMIDLSIGWNSVLAASVFSLSTVFFHVPVLAGLVLGVACATALGFLQGMLVSRVGVPSFVVTLGGAMVAEGVTLGILTPHGGSVPLADNLTTAIGTLNLDPVWSWVASVALFGVYAGLTLNSIRKRAAGGSEGGYAAVMRLIGVGVMLFGAVFMLNAYRGVPFLLMIFLIALFASAFVTKSTRFGRHLYAVGGNAEAARRAGISVRGIQLAVFVIAGFLVGLAGYLDAARLGVASASVGNGDIMLNAVAAAVIGGTSLFGGRGSVYGALFGALVIESVSNGMNLLGAASSVRFIVEGGILLAAITIDTVLRLKRMRSGRA
ncbi:MAG: ATPase [Acidiphilium sp.]|jgi:ABC-type xylose transport system, permease component|uniref:Xylose transport system permease protein XylH n=1 Tax=Acidiphilium acidophilum TaxID=76588 RepID=A0AAW9DTF2_ACIAO|nr:ATPase [Acidiphilium acidophilum]MDD2861834.1 ATPase [Acidiphilium sp.]MDX5931921.1 ATPase [Acidiphilium acidophilum]MEE3502726.1 ATPase [Acidiphilium acidophilum]GBQ12698.1 xylose ABC transporter permease [Acidiphilium acidophilum DSM 700]